MSKDDNLILEEFQPARKASPPSLTLFSHPRFRTFLFFYRFLVLEPHNLQSTQIATSSRLFVYERDAGYAKSYPRDSELCVSFREYSRTSRKLPPKMQRLKGRLREVVVYEKRTF